MKKTKQQIREELKLDRLPDDEFMQLLEAVGEGPVVAGPGAERLAQEYTPEQIKAEVEVAVVNGKVGNLLARARADSGLSLRLAGEEAGVTRGRIQQLENSENVEVATLVRVAAALGYSVRISLTPKQAGKQPLTAELDAVHA
jgi:hypothetical protein